MAVREERIEVWVVEKIEGKTGTLLYRAVCNSVHEAEGVLRDLGRDTKKFQVHHWNMMERAKK